MAKTQTLSFPIRLPDAMQAEALRLLDASTSAINQMLADLWPSLDLFAAERVGPAWKQVEKHLLCRSGHGSRQERCEMEQAGRILRAQASRKQVFQAILPLLSEGLIRPAEGSRPATKDYRAIKERVRTLRAEVAEADTFMAMTNVIEQACNVYLQTETFPTTYEAMQPLPVQEVGQLTFAGDDGMHDGQTYRARIEVSQVCALASRQEQCRASLWLKLRAPDGQGNWAWGAWSEEIPLPATVFSYLWQGARPQAPTLREISNDDGNRVAVLDVILEVPAQYVPPLEQETRVLGWDWGVRSLITVSILEKPEGEEPYRQISRPVFLDSGGLDGRQARLRREIDRLKACQKRYDQLVEQACNAREEQCVPLPPHFARWQAQSASYARRIGTCWKKYERRNRELAHLAANLLILLALLYDCRLICGENLTTLKTEGRGRGVRGRWRNWRNNTTVRGELWRVLKYKCHLLGIRARQVEPRGTTHTCPHCGKPANTYRSPATADRKQALEWAPWLCCDNPKCLWNGARDYAASLNIARLGLAYLLTYHQTRRYQAYRMTEKSVKPASYSGAGATRLVPSQGIKPRPFEGKHIFYAGWSFSTSLRTSHPNSLVAVLSTSQLRKDLLSSA
ncbi:MAG TPA: zinc ribbon domain-containing protein [Ktedonobacteraceae bacterium]|nr:zinc ribbon domain-containing protein [Ktedonobacteraceae bacterium]